jgi:hypothetical protein
MKDLIIAITAFACAAASYGQGAIVFSTHTGSGATQVDAPATLGVENSRGLGPAYSAQLYLVNATSLTPLFPITTFNAAGSGVLAIADRYVVPRDVTVPGVPSGANVTLRMVAWETSLGGTYETVRDIGLGFSGQSPDLSVTLGGGLLPPANLVGLQGFVIRFPEPTTLALGFLGAAALFIRRRSKSVA